MIDSTLEKILIYLSDNKEWLFSGMGLIVIPFLWRFLKTTLHFLKKRLCQSSELRNENTLSEDDNDFLLESLHQIIDSIYEKISADKEYENYKGQMKTISNLIKIGGYTNFRNAREKLKMIIESIMEHNNQEITQKTVEGLTTLFLLTNDTHNIKKYYERIKEMYPDLPRNDKLNEIFDKYNVRYPVSNNENIELRRIELSLLNEIFHELTREKGTSVRFALDKKGFIYRDPKESTIKWTCKPGYKIQREDGTETGNIKTNLLSRKYNFEEIKRVVEFLNEKNGYTP